MYIDQFDGAFIRTRDFLILHNIDHQLICHPQHLESYTRQLKEYFSGQRKEFDLPCHLLGTDFQIKVWQALRDISYSQTITYSDLAHKINRPKAIRAVAQAVAKSPLLIILPCHRVIGKSGKLIGYRCGLEMKKYLLELETKNI